MKLLTLIFVAALTALAAHAQTPAPAAVIEARLTTPLNPLLASVPYAPQFTVFAGVQNPALGAIYIVFAAVQGTKQAYTASGFINPPTAPNLLSVCMLNISMVIGETLPVGTPAVVNVYLTITGPTGLPVVIKVN